jgi:hypothetical protein
MVAWASGGGGCWLAGRWRREKLAAVRTVRERAGAVLIEFWQNAAAFRTEFDARTWRTESSPAFIAVRRGPFSGSEERRQEDTAFVATFGNR